MYVCMYSYHYYLYYYIVGSTVKFSQISYSTAEDNGALQTVLILSNPLSSNITIEVVDINGTSIGKLNILVNKK